MTPNVVLLDVQPIWFGDKPDSQDYNFGHCLAIAAEAQAMVNLVYLEQHPGTPLMYSTHIKYIAEPAQPMRMFGIPTIIERGGSDCKNLVAWRLAELWLQESKSAPIGYGNRISHVKTYWKPMPNGKLKRVFHAEIRLPAWLPNGQQNPETVEDPSRFLGM